MYLVYGWLNDERVFLAKFDDLGEAKCFASRQNYVRTDVVKEETQVVVATVFR